MKRRTICVSAQATLVLLTLGCTDETPTGQVPFDTLAGNIRALASGPEGAISQLLVNGDLESADWLRWSSLRTRDTYDLSLSAEHFGITGTLAQNRE